jgi:Na+/proline symporter
MDAVQYFNSPQMFKANVSPFDNTTMWVLLSILICFITIFPLLFCLTVTKHTRKYAIKVMKEIDLNPITGGEKRLVVGGVISMVYCIILVCCSGGIIAKYFLFNERVEATELSNISHQNNLPESYVLNVTVSLKS